MRGGAHVKPEALSHAQLCRHGPQLHYNLAPHRALGGSDRLFVRERVHSGEALA